MRYLLIFIFLMQGFILASDKPDFKEVTLYYSPRCPHSQRVLSYIRENHLEVPLKDALHDKQARDELELYGGHAIVPCLLVDKSPIYNDHSIIQWLSDHQQFLIKPKPLDITN